MKKPWLLGAVIASALALCAACAYRVRDRDEPLLTTHEYLNVCEFYETYGPRKVVIGQENAKGHTFDDTLKYFYNGRLETVAPLGLHTIQAMPSRSAHAVLTMMSLTPATTFPAKDVLTHVRNMPYTIKHLIDTTDKFYLINMERVAYGGLYAHYANRHWSVIGVTLSDSDLVLPPKTLLVVCKK